MQTFPLLFACLSKIRSKIHSLVDFPCLHLFRRSENVSTENTVVTMLHILEYTWNILLKPLKDFSLKWHNFAVVVGPFYAFTFHGIKTTTIDLKLPFIDESSNVEFIANILYLCIIGMHRFLAYIIIEVAMTIFGDAITISSKLIEYELWKLDEAKLTRSIHWTSKTSDDFL